MVTGDSSIYSNITSTYLIYQVNSKLSNCLEQHKYTQWQNNKINNADIANITLKYQHRFMEDFYADTFFID